MYDDALDGPMFTATSLASVAACPRHPPAPTAAAAAAAAAVLVLPCLRCPQSRTRSATNFSDCTSAHLLVLPLHT